MHPPESSQGCTGGHPGGPPDPRAVDPAAHHGAGSACALGSCSLCERVTNMQVAEELHVTKRTVGKWRSRFIMAGLRLLDEPAVVPAQDQR